MHRFFLTSLMLFSLAVPALAVNPTTDSRAAAHDLADRVRTAIASAL